MNTLLDISYSCKNFLSDKWKAQYGTFLRHEHLLLLTRNISALYQNDVEKFHGKPNFEEEIIPAYDRNKVIEQCKQKYVDFPFGDQHINVKEEFKRCNRLNRGIGMARALKQLRIPLEGKHHRGVDDANNTAKILHWCLNNQ